MCSKPNHCKLARASRKNQTFFTRYKINQQPTEPDDEQNSSKKPETKDRDRLILVCAFVALMTFVVIERIFIKDDMLLNYISSTLSFIVGYYFSLPKTKK